MTKPPPTTTITPTTQIPTTQIPTTMKTTQSPNDDAVDDDADDDNADADDEDNADAIPTFTTIYMSPFKSVAVLAFLYYFWRRFHFIEFLRRYEKSENGTKSLWYERYEKS